MPRPTPTSPTPRAPAGTLEVRIYASELAVLIDEVALHPHRETGGDLLGQWSHGDAPTIWLATRPGPRAIHARAHFQQDPVTHKAVERRVWEHYGLQCVGMWHSHHHLGLHELSRGDLARTQRYSSRYRRRRFVDLLAYHHRGWHLKPIVYRDATVCRTAWSTLVVLPGESPVRTAMRAAGVAMRGALRDAPHGPVRPCKAVPGAPVWPASAPSEEDDAPPLVPPPPAVGPASVPTDPGPWRAIDAVEHLVHTLVPQAQQDTLALEVRGDWLALSVAHTDRTLTVALSYDTALRVRGWEIRGPRPITGAPSDDAPSALRLALETLTHG